VVGSKSRAGRFTLRKGPGTGTGGWAGPRAGLEGCGKSRPPPGFDPRTFSPQPVAIPTALNMKSLVVLSNGTQRTETWHNKEARCNQADEAASPSSPPVIGTEQRDTKHVMY
jgi:hypothetical protein